MRWGAQRGESLADLLREENDDKRATLKEKVKRERNEKEVKRKGGEKEKKKLGKKGQLGLSNLWKDVDG